MSGCARLIRLLAIRPASARRLASRTHTRIAARSKDDIISVESTWGWDAPRQRMAKFLWRALHGNTSAERPSGVLITAACGHERACGSYFLLEQTCERCG
jgi:hypothetical protein